MERPTHKLLTQLLNTSSFLSLGMTIAASSHASQIKRLAELSYGIGDDLFLHVNDPEYERISRDEILSMMSKGCFLIGMLVDGVLGVCVYISHANPGQDLTEMSVLAIHPKLQGGYLSERVLENAFMVAGALGYSHVESDVLACKPWLQKYYEKRGWNLTGEVKAWPEEKMKYVKSEYVSMASSMHRMMRHPTILRQERIPLSTGGTWTSSSFFSHSRRDDTKMLRDYWRQGFVVCENLFSSEEMQALSSLARRAALEELDRAIREKNSATLLLIQDPDNKQHPRKLERPCELPTTSAAFLQLVQDVRITSRVQALLGDMHTSPRLLLEQVFCKGPGGGAKPPHQDNYFFEIYPLDHVLTCWVALDDSTVDVGCMEYLVGSHVDKRHGVETTKTKTKKSGLRSHNNGDLQLRKERGERWSSSTDNVSKASLSASAIMLEEEETMLKVPVARGSVIFHHGTVVHASNRNVSPSQWRVAHSSHWSKQNVRSTSSILEDSERLQHMVSRRMGKL